MPQHTTNRSLSLRATLRLTTTGLTILIGVLMLQQVAKEWQRMERLQSLEHATFVSDALFDATDKLAVERDLTFALLHAPANDMADSLSERLPGSRQETDAAFEAAYAAIKQYGFGELDKLHETVDAQMPEIRALRSEVDLALRLPRAERDATLAKRWYDAINTLTQETQDSWVTFIKQFTDIDPVVTQHLRYKYFLRVITDYTGKQRMLVGKLLAETTSPSAQDTEQLQRWQGSLDLAWNTARQLAIQTGLYDKVQPDFDATYKQYSDLYDKTIMPFISSAAEARPLSANDWFALSAKAGAALSTLKDVSKTIKHDYLASLLSATRQHIAVRLLFLLCAAGLSFYCFQLISRRVIRPINGAIDSLEKAIRGEVVSFVPQVGSDEIAKLITVLDAFQQNARYIKRAAEELAYSEARYRALCEAGGQVIWVWKDGAIAENSPLMAWWEEVTGHSGHEIATTGWLDLVHPDDRASMEKIWEDARREGRAFDLDYRLRRRDGSYCHIFSRGVPILDGDGSVKEFVGTLTDVTERKEAEANLLHYTRALERSNKELDDFAYIASHDLKEPLRGIHNHARFLLEDNESKLDAESVRRLNRLTYLSQRMEKLVNDLLYFSRLGRQDMAIQKTAVADMIRDIESTLDAMLVKNHVHIGIPKPLPEVVCDRTSVTEVFRNLIVNAIKYNDKREKLVHVGFLAEYRMPDGAKVNNVFYVKDNGVGIAPEFHQEVFRIFKRLQRPDESEQEGTGAGLTFVKKIVERHNGKIWLESQPGKGTTFYFFLGGQVHDDNRKIAA